MKHLPKASIPLMGLECTRVEPMVAGSSTKQFQNSRTFPVASTIKASLAPNEAENYKQEPAG